MAGARTRGSVLVLVCVLAACNGTELWGNRGQLEVEGHSSSGAVTIGRQVDWDFGASYPEAPVSGMVRVRNDGRGDLSLDEAELQDNSGAFSVAFTASRVPAGGFVDVPVTFKPPVASEPRAFEASLTFHASDANPDENTAEVSLHGLAVASPCMLPEVVDFGTVELDVTHSVPLSIANPLSQPAQADVSAITSDSADQAVFGFGVQGLPGAFALPAGSGAELPLTFRPTQARNYEAKVQVKAGTGCPNQNVTLRGTGIEQVLVWDEKLPFGYVPVGLHKVGTAVIRNIGTRDIDISDFHMLAGASDFAVGIDTPSTLTVPARGTAEFHALFHPDDLGPRSGTLTFKTPVPSQQQGVISLEGFGGGPDIEVQPADLLNFGQVGFVPSVSPPLFQTRRVMVLNVGTRFSGAGPEANLHFRDTPFTVTPSNSNTAPDEFQVSLPDAYDNATGLPAVAVLNAVAVTVKLTPQSIGRKEATLTIHTDDVDEPDVTLSVVADVVQVPPCNFRVTPAAIEFGVLSPPDSSTEHFKIQNLGALPEQHCLVSMVELLPGSDSAFSLPDGVVPFHDIGPGEELAVAVKATAPSANPLKMLSGSVQFQVNAPSSPMVEVPLSGASTEQCLKFSPDEISFGTVRAGCSSPTKAVAINNACTQSVTIKAISVVQAGNEYTLSAPPLGSGVALDIGALPLEAQLRYTPLVSGNNPATLKVSAEQFGANISYLIPINGKADATGANTDSFVQPPRMPVDILLAFDPASGMSQEKAQLMAHIGNFFDYLQKSQIQYQFAVVLCQGFRSVSGILQTGPTNPEPILDPSVPNVVTKAIDKVDVPLVSGGASNCFDSMYDALTPPLSTGANAAFLRPAARLAMVAVAEWENSVSHPTNFYLTEIPKLKGASSKQLLTFNTLAPIDPIQMSQCSPQLYPEPGSLRALSALTGGLSADVCSSSWPDMLRDMAERATGFKTNFPLTLVPDLAQSPLDVEVNGAPVSSTDSSGATVWTYEPAQNRVRFEPDHAPQPGDTIDVTYIAQCQ